MSARKTLGIFDSGYGGMSVLSEACRRLSNASYFYYADSDHVPYGSRTNDEILRYSDEAVGFLFQQGADAVIIACNTASAVAAAPLRSKYDKPIIAMEPAVRPALHEENGARVLVMATPVTLREEKLKNLIAREHGQERIDLLPMPALVEFAEEEEFDGPKVRDYLRERLRGYDLSRYTAIVLGCTHFNYFKPVMRKLLSEEFHADLHLIEGSGGTVRRAASLLGMEYADRPQEEADSYSSLAQRDSSSGSCLTMPDPQSEVRFFVSGREVAGDAEKAHIARLLRQLERGM